MEHLKSNWNIVNDNSKSNYAAANKITYNTKILKSNLCDYNVAYISATGNIDGTTINDAQVDVDLDMPMYNLIEYSSNYSEIAGSLWFYSKDKATNFNVDTGNTDNSKHNAKLIGNTVAQPGANVTNGILRNVTIFVPLKYLSNFWKLFEIPLVNCKVE